MTYLYNRTNINIIKTGDNEFFVNHVRGIEETARWEGLTHEDAAIAASRFGFECAARFYAKFGYSN